jgi:hypothetical protein
MLHQGLKLPHIYTLQGIACLTNLLNRNHLQTITGFLHQENLDQMLVSVDLRILNMEYSHKQYGQLATFGLLECAWRFLSEANIAFHHDVTVATYSTT